MDAKAKVVAREYRHKVLGQWSGWKPCTETDALYFSVDPDFETRAFIHLADHEAEMAELVAERDTWGKAAGAWQEIANRRKEENHYLLTGLEALAGEWERLGSPHKLYALKIRTLTNSAKGNGDGL